MRQVLLAVMLVLGVTMVAAAQAADELIAQPQVREVSLFKNGLGWFVQQGTLRGDGVLNITDVPAAVHGSIWLGYDPARLTVRALTARRATYARTRPAVTIPEMLRANIGRTVEIFFDDTSRRGVITAIPEGEQPVVQPQYQREFGSRIIPPSGDIMLFTADGRTEAIRLNEVQRVAGDATLVTSLPYDEEKPVLEVSFAARQAEAYTLAYLARGVAWAPAYRIDISNADKATLRLQGTFINEAQDLTDVTVNFISGFPNLTQTGVISPLANIESLDAFLNSLGGGSGYRRNENRMMAQSAVFANAPGFYGGDAVLPVAGDGDYAGDLFYYRVPHVTLQKNERAAFDLLSDRVPYEHIYTWQIAPGGAPQGRYQRSETTENETVWHEIKFTNTFSQPLTTGPALVVEGGRILGQDVLNYCAAGGEGRVKITKALDIRAEQVETEQARQHDARTFNGNRHDKVTVEGTLSLRNFKREAVTVEISRTVSGEFISSSTTCAAVKRAEAVRAVNPTTDLKWTVTIPAGGKLDITYSYVVYVR